MNKSKLILEQRTIEGRIWNSKSSETKPYRLQKIQQQQIIQPVQTNSSDSTFNRNHTKIDDSRRTYSDAIESKNIDQSTNTKSPSILSPQIPRRKETKRKKQSS